MSFLTLEDINGTLFRNQGFYWHEINTANITTGSEDFSNVKYDFCTISRTYNDETEEFEYTIVINADNWTRGFMVFSPSPYGTYTGYSDRVIIRRAGSVRIGLYMGSIQLNNTVRMSWRLTQDSISLNLKELSQQQTIPYENDDGDSFTQTQYVNQGYNSILFGGYGSYMGHLLVNLVKTDFQFNCTQSLTLGKVNTVSLGTDTDYKYGGDMVGTYTPVINVEYDGELIPVTWNEDVNDYTFDLDLIDVTEEGKIRFNVIVDSNEVLNYSKTEVSLNTSFETINDETKLQTLFSNGGIGRLGSNITISTDLTVNKDVYLIGNNKTVNLNTYKIILPENHTFKALNTIFTNGENSIQQNTGSKVELTNCTFTGCTGIGSVIDCQVDIDSLDNPTDYTTILTDCTITNCDMAILHGGELTVTGCTVTGKTGNKDFPYFLYQTDGEAELTNNSFTISNDTASTTDLQFNPCIFICGENALINGSTHTVLQANNLESFLTAPQNNQSSISLTYYYDLIEDYITLTATKGYCHGVSGIDYIFKTNTNVRRVE